jgi:hypothetical protein
VEAASVLSVGKAARLRPAPEAADAGPVVVTWRDVLAFVDTEPTDIDYVINPVLWCDPGDGGAPAEVYAHPRLLRAWLLELHPHWVCEGPECRKQHPGVRKGTVCDGSTAEINAKNRTSLEISHKVRAVDSKRRWSAAETLAYLKENL